MRGFSVLEVVVAATLFTISVLALFGVFPLSARAVRQAEERNLASHLANNRLVLARSSSFGSLGSRSPENVTVDFIHQGATHTQIFEVEQVVNSLSPKLKNVAALVRWSSDNRNQELQLETQVADFAP
jgi:Tfp pilus assembly protein PilV